MSEQVIQALKTLIPAGLRKPLAKAYRAWRPLPAPPLSESQPAAVPSVNAPLSAAPPARPRDPNELRPPDEMVYVGPGDYTEIGQHFLPLFINPGGLLPTDRVLDVGCGIGRMAVPLTGYLTTGTYEGFDIVPMGIEWCQQNISPKFPNFHFQLADVYNQYYHPEGTCAPAQYRFPYEDASFDFIFLTSVFTHMLPRDLEAYFAQVARVLKPGARCFITFYILNAETDALIEAGRTPMTFAYPGDGYRTVSEEVPESVIAFPEAYVRELFQRHGLAIVEPVHFGLWCGRAQGITYQDVVVATKQ